MRNLLFIATLSLFASASPAEALICNIIGGCDCTVTASDVDFGSFSPLNGAQTAQGEITVDCTGVLDVLPALAVKIGPGQWGSVSARKMRTSGGHELSYNLYGNSQHSIIWGDGTGGTSAYVVSGGLLTLGHWRVTQTIYGLASPTVATRPGAYNDLVTVRIDW